MVGPSPMPSPLPQQRQPITLCENLLLLHLLNTQPATGLAQGLHAAADGGSGAGLGQTALRLIQLRQALTAAVLFQAALALDVLPALGGRQPHEGLRQQLSLGWAAGGSGLAPARAGSQQQGSGQGDSSPGEMVWTRHD